MYTEDETEQMVNGALWLGFVAGVMLSIVVAGLLSLT